MRIYPRLTMPCSVAGITRNGANQLSDICVRTWRKIDMRVLRFFYFQDFVTGSVLNGKVPALHFFATGLLIQLARALRTSIGHYNIIPSR